MVYIVGLGPGSSGTLTVDAYNVIGSADVIIGAKRLLESIPEGTEAKCFEAVMPGDIMAVIDDKCKDASGSEQDVAVIMSGDTGFYSGTKGLVSALEEAGKEYLIVPGISSVQMLSARLGEAWQDWKLVSAHGKSLDPVAALTRTRKTFFLTGGELKASDIARILCEVGLGDIDAVCASFLSYDNEKIVEGKVSEIAEIEDIPDLSVMLVGKLPEPDIKAYAPGIDDSLFIRGDVPMTKQDVRSAIIGRLSIKPGDIVWDVGAGTGSCTIEMAKMNHGAKVFAVETEEEGCRLIEENRKAFGCWNIKVVQGMAPDALKDLQAPDVVFIGGSKGNMRGILELIKEKNSAARVLVSAIAVETLEEAKNALAELGWSLDITEIQSSYGKKVGKLNMMMANNPIFLIQGIPE